MNMKNRMTRPKPTAADVDVANTIGRLFLANELDKAAEVAMLHRRDAAIYSVLHTTQQVIAWDNDLDGEEGLKELCMRIRKDVESTK